jgi:hypothetical protein
MTARGRPGGRTPSNDVRSAQDKYGDGRLIEEMQWFSTWLSSNSLLGVAPKEAYRKAQRNVIQ